MSKTLNSKNWVGKFCEFGGQLSQLVYRPWERSILVPQRNCGEFTGDPFLHGLPILFPPGRIENGDFSGRGRQYLWPINDETGKHFLHGFVWNKRFKLQDWTNTKVQWQFSTLDQENWNVGKQYGHDFSLTMGYDFGENYVGIKALLHNYSADPMPFALGYHMNISLRSGGSQVPYRIKLPAMQQWELHSDLLPTGRLLPNNAIANGQSLEDVVLDTPFRVNDPCENSITLIGNDQRQIVINPDTQFAHWVFYRPNKDSEFFSVEPYSWVPNAPNLPLPADVVGLRYAEPDETIAFDLTLSCLG